jgi:hypothetical protein
MIFKVFCSTNYLGTIPKENLYKDKQILSLGSTIDIGQVKYIIGNIILRKSNEIILEVIK